MKAAKVMDIISRLPGCDGQAAHAVSVCTQVKMEDARILLKNPKSECPDIFFDRDTMKIVDESPDTCYLPTSSHQTAQVAVLTHHFGCGRSGAITPTTPPRFQQR